MNPEITVVINSFVSEINESVELPASRVIIHAQRYSNGLKKGERAGGYVKESSVYHQHTFLYSLFDALQCQAGRCCTTQLP